MKPQLRVCLALLAASAADAQLSPSAYRVLGQRGFQANSPNMVQGFELNSPSAIALDTRNGTTRLYIADTSNHRILAYPDAAGYTPGDPPALLLAQPNRQFTAPNGIGLFGLNTPVALAVERVTGDLYVSDFGNNRILRFPDPFANPSRVEPDAVYGQGSSVPTRTTLSRPRGLAFDSGGNLWVADSGHNRVVRLSAATLTASNTAEFDTVIGQRDFVSAAVNAGGVVSAAGFDQPTALVFDAQDNLYVADFNNTRVVRFARPLGPANQGPAATAVWGQVNLGSRGVPSQPTSSSLGGPAGLALDEEGNLLVAVSGDNRILVFSTRNPATAATAVFGQPDFSTNEVNLGAWPRAKANTLFSPRDVRVDAQGNVFVADGGNHRVLMFPARSRSASLVWGQIDFRTNSPNQAKPAGMNSPSKIAIDYSSAPFALYVSDTSNSRVLVWRDSVHFRDGDPADLVIGQPDFETVSSNTEGGASFLPSNITLSRPVGLAVGGDGTLYVADTGNNRVLRFPRPIDQTGRIAADAVIGQVDFVSNTSALVSASSLRAPIGVALAPNGNLFVGDTGNNRVLEFPAGAGTNSSAIRVYGQPTMNSAELPAQVSAQTLSRPRGVFVDASFNLYVADSLANRVLIFPNTQAAPSAGIPAAVAIGQEGFDTNTPGVLRGPTDVGLDSYGFIYVVDFSTNRVLVFPSLIFLPLTGGAPVGVVGQRDLNSNAPNWDSTTAGLATAKGLFAPLGLFVDRRDTLYVADLGNNRVVHFLRASALANAATLQREAPLALGGLVTLFASSLTDTASDETVPSVWADKPRGDWTTVASGREVVINDQLPAPIYYLNASQTTFQVPRGTPLGANRIAVRVAETGELIAGGTAAVAAVAPGIFTVGTSTQAAATNEDGRVNTASNPAARGSIVTLVGTGQGQVSPAVPDGVAAAAEPLSRTVTVLAKDVRGCSAAQAMCVLMGTAFGDIQSSGLAPEFVGVWQIKVRIPLTAPPGNAVPVRVIINGVPSNTVAVSIR